MRGVLGSRGLPSLPAGVRWQILEFVRRDSRHIAYYRARCACGREKVTQLGNLRRITECRTCSNRRRFLKHGATLGNPAGTPEWRAWQNAIHRCDYPNHPSWKHYGGRGIRVHPDWLGREGFARFLSHIGPKPTPKHSVDRIDVNGNYEPGNVRWATAKEQRANQRPRAAV